jgi:3-isopropylmalate/(R)-2-methylmalate dehydratase small subunit
MPIERITRVTGSGLPLRGDNIDTDRIIPARFLRSVSFEGLERHLFEDDIAQAAAQGRDHPLVQEQYRGAAVLVVNENFGCGSSREHAPQAIRRRGFGAVVGESYSEIFFGNSVALGMPCVTASAADVERLQAFVERHPDAPIALDLGAMKVRFGGSEADVSLPPAARESFLDGSWDGTAILLDRYEDVERTASRLPYLSSGWSA